MCTLCGILSIILHYKYSTPLYSLNDCANFWWTKTIPFTEASGSCFNVSRWFQTDSFNENVAFLHMYMMTSEVIHYSVDFYHSFVIFLMNREPLKTRIIHIIRHIGSYNNRQCLVKSPEGLIISYISMTFHVFRQSKRLLVCLFIQSLSSSQESGLPVNEFCTNGLPL